MTTTQSSVTIRQAQPDEADPLTEDEAYLDDLFVEPTYIDTGVGALLWRYAVRLATEMGASALEFGADPNAPIQRAHSMSICAPSLSAKHLYHVPRSQDIQHAL